MIFSFLAKKGKIGGYIALNKLEDWWLSSFTDEERKRIREVVGSTWKPFDFNDDSDLQKYNKPDPLKFLTGMAGWFSNSKDHTLALKIIKKAEEYATPNADILDLHFFYPTKMRIYNIGKPDPASIKVIIQCCQKQIELAPRSAKEFINQYKGDLPVHEGYDRLVSILERDKKYSEAIKYAIQAKKQGWGTSKWGNGQKDTWDSQIEKLNKKINS